MTTAGQDGVQGVPGLSKHRVEALTDGIYAIAMTLAVLNIDIGSLPPGTDYSTLGPALVSIWPQILHYTIAFLTLGAFWIGLHRQFHWIRSVDRTFIWFALANLLFISLIPFTSSLAGDYSGAAIAVQLFAANMMLIGLTMALGWRYASTDHRLIDPGLSHAEILFSYRKSLVTPLIAVAVMVVATVLPDVAMLCFLLIAPAHHLLHRHHFGHAPVASRS